MIWPFSLLFKPKKPIRKWPGNVITYAFREESNGIRFTIPKHYRAVIRECAAEWSEVTNITLEHESFYSTPEPNIIISLRYFADKNWLGYAYFPGNTSLSGDIDLSSRDWFKDNGIDFFKTVILHEFGHALGLEHSPNKSSIMYKHATAKKIHAFDIENINEAYKHD